MRDMVNQLKKHKVNFTEKGGEDPQQSIDNANSGFVETIGKVFKVKADIIPLKEKETINTKKKLDLFNKNVQSFREEFLQSLPFDYDDKMTMDEINASYSVVLTYRVKLVKIEQEAHNQNNLEKLFELQRSHYK